MCVCVCVCVCLCVCVCECVCVCVCVYTDALEDLFVTLSLSPLEEEGVGAYVCVVL